MRYYLIAGEASGDLHASHLMQSLKEADAQAEFRFFGGDLMQAVGGTLVKHYRELAYMGFVQVALHLRTILGNMSLCKEDIVRWKPDAVILVDYPGFNLNIAQFVKAKTLIPVYYYIAPKIWAWKEYRIKNIRRDVSELFSILPFEVDFFERKHHYPLHYVGNPTACEVADFRSSYTEQKEDFCRRNGLKPDRPIIALLAGSRRQEIKGNLPAMIRVGSELTDYQLVLAGDLCPALACPRSTGDQWHGHARDGTVRSAAGGVLPHGLAPLHRVHEKDCAECALRFAGQPDSRQGDSKRTRGRLVH